MKYIININDTKQSYNQLKIYLIKNFDACLVINSKHMNSLFQKLIILQKERIKVLQKRRIIHTLNYRLVLNIWQLWQFKMYSKNQTYSFYQDRYAYMLKQGNAPVKQ